MKIFSFLKRNTKPQHPADANMERYLTWWRKYEPRFTDKKPVLQRIYTDMYDNNWYLHADTLQISEERAAAIDEAATNLDWNLTPHERNTRLRGFSDIANMIDQAAGDVEKISKLTRKLRNDAADMIYRASSMPQKQLLIEVALVFFVIDDENPLFVNVETQNRKREIVIKDDNLRAFFLRNVFDIFKATATDDGRTFLRYLDQQSKKKATRNALATTKRSMRNAKKTGG